MNTLITNLHKFINEPYNDKICYNLGYEYYLIGHTSIAFSYFLRCAEFTNNTVIACEALLLCSKCLNLQENRSQKEYDLILHAISISPNTPQGYYIKCLYHSFRNEMTECYSTACTALEITDDSHKFIHTIGYNDFKDFLHQKSFSGFHLGKLKESYAIIIQYFTDSILIDKFPEYIKTEWLINKSEIPVKNVQSNQIKDSSKAPYIQTNQIRDSNKYIKNKSIPGVIIVDDFYTNPDEIRNYALSINYSEPENHGAVGYRCENGKKIFDGTKDYFEKILNTRIQSHSSVGGWDYGTNGCFQWCPLGTPLVYHADSQEYAGIIYLTPDAPPECGTSFLRHNKYKITNGNEIFKKHDWDNSDVKYKDPFINKLNWELVDKIGNVYNRLVIFKSHSVHAVSEYFGEDIHNSRLFQLFFFDIDKSVTPQIESNQLNTDNETIVKNTINDENIDIIVNTYNPNNLLNFPKVFVLSIPQNKNRQDELIKDGNRYNLDIEIFQCKKYPECNSKVSSNYNINLVAKHNIGVTCGHIKMLQYWYENFTEEYAFFCEDDIDFSVSENWMFTWDQFMTKLDSNWSIVQTVVICENTDQINFNLSHKICDHYSVTGYLIKRDYCKYIIDQHYVDDTTYNLNLSYNDNSTVQAVIPEDLLFRQDELYNDKYFYPLSIPLFVEKNNFTTEVSHIKSNNFINEFYCNSKYDLYQKYIFLPYQDIEDNDIYNESDKTIDELLIIADTQVECKAVNTQGGFKHSLSKIKPSKIKGLYIKKQYISEIEF